MSITINNKQVAVSYNALAYLSNSVALPAKPGFQIGHAMRLVEPAFKAYEEQRLKLVQKFVKRDDAGTIVEKPGQPGQAEIADQAGFDAELKDLQSAEVTIAVSEVTLDSLGDVQVPPFVFGALDWLIVA